MLSHTMRYKWTPLAATACLLMGIAAPLSTLSAETITVDMTHFTGSDLLGRAILEQVGDDIKVTLTTVQEDGYLNTGDWGAFWFNINDDSLLAGLSIVGDDVTAYDFSGSVGWVGSHNNLNGAGSPGLMDVGIALGQPGSSDGLLEMTMFTLSHPDGLSLSIFDHQTFAGRLRSVGPAPDGGDGSSKIVGDNTIPEPATAVWLMMGAASMALRRGRSR